MVRAGTNIGGYAYIQAYTHPCTYPRGLDTLVVGGTETTQVARTDLQQHHKGARMAGVWGEGCEIFTPIGGLAEFLLERFSSICFHFLFSLNVSKT